MYEEKEGMYEPAASQNAYRRRTWSQTDAYIAALIARKSGMQNISGYGQTIRNLLFHDYATQSEQTPPFTMTWDTATVPQLVQQSEPEIPQSVQQLTGYEMPYLEKDYRQAVDVRKAILDPVGSSFLHAPRTAGMYCMQGWFFCALP